MHEGSPKLPHAALDKGKERERAYDPRDQGRLSPRGERRIDRERERITHPRRVGSPIAREQERISRAGVVAAPLEKVSSGSATSRRSAMKDGVTNSSMSSAGVTARVKKIKHGSFDFERPVSNDVGAGMSVKAALKSMGVGDHSAPHGLHRSSSAKGTPRKERDGNVRADFRSQHVSSEPLQSRSRGKPVLDVNTHDLTRRTTGSSTASRPHPSAHHREAGNQNAHTLDYIPASPISSNSGNSSGMTSSWGRSAGKRMTRPSHPPFKFEPAVPPIPGSPAVDEQRGTPYRSTPTTRVHAEEIQPIPQPSKLRQARTAGKGRSLDLGLGLSWAPSRVREDAILHIGVSGPSSTATGATRIRTRWRGADVDEEGRLGLGTAADVAEAFREALGDAAYGTFKTYVHRFDAHAIPLDGPYGLLTHIRRLLDSAPGLDARSKQRLLDRFVRVVQENR
ncbi:hypothetical protein CERSUDRAFT_111506 [Gelatoporia subvermispora B]|uniref:Uncharacterized protein n=1 Tax=Ceriporiopsis subvermispora (strain B) TaxID=914234 RepID=M2QV24_CERS8|nr:hypothetical protein CERSUDRAFT_111506 [Gelatoporia subvermispora B]